jgi:heme/copper-type cytochrome/quinol oxidase subunit 4
MISAFALVTLVVVIIVFHFLMWWMEKMNSVDTSKEIPCR